ncbi:MAG: site-specific DNA-methyltransferase [Planctomycetes bacterium]|nr:site-specific DNA-methyltransferase [Planctomycetota bacterium]
MTEHDDATERFDLRSLDIAAQKRAELLRLFPECATEGGKLDFERLKAALGEQIDAGRERYGLSWPGKAACFQAIQRPSLATLRPRPDQSIDFDSTQNLIIEGDNLEVLKLLQKSYLGKVKMIYIDPPYNTGNDFIYPDNYTESLQTYLEYTGQVDAEGRRFSTNTEADGRFHSKWLNMMYPRLYLARNLLREDGVIFISIDDCEVDNLRRICNELFGEENFLACVCWQKADSPKMDAEHFSVMHDYVLVFSRSVDRSKLCRVKYEGDEMPAHFNRTDASGRRYYLKPLRAMGGQGETREARPGLHFGIESPDGTLVFPKLQNGADGAWRWSPEKVARERHRIEWVGHEGQWTPYYRIMADESAGRPPETVLSHEDVGSNRTATAEMKQLFQDQKPFDSPKPTGLLRHILTISTELDDIVLDFFAGSGTTAHAVLEQNKKDGGNRKFILVQLPEPTGRADYPNIAEITKERVRRVIGKLNAAEAGLLRPANEAKPDRGFRVFQLASSNFKPWDADRSKDAAALERQLFDHLEHVLEGRSEQDLLYEILLKDGFELSTPIETIEVKGFRVHRVAEGAMLICLQDALTHELIVALAELHPERVVFLDRGFRDNDQLTANAAKLFASKTGESFKKFKTV